MAKQEEDYYGLYYVENTKNTFKITDDDDETKLTINDEELSPFVFAIQELPDSYNWDYVTKLNEIEYPEGYQTDQIFGAYLQPISWSGNFYGPWVNEEGEIKSAKERSDVLEKIYLAQKPVKVFFGMDVYEGNKGIFIIKEFKRQIKNYFDVDYSIEFKYHMPQTRVKPKKASQLQVQADVNNVPAAPTPPNRSANNRRPGGKNPPKRPQRPGGGGGGGGGGRSGGPPDFPGYQ